MYGNYQLVQGVNLEALNNMNVVNPGLYIAYNNEPGAQNNLSQNIYIDYKNNTSGIKSLQQSDPEEVRKK